MYQFINYTPWKVQIGVDLRKKVLWSDANIKICGTSIKIVNSTKCLGIEIDSKLSWDKQIDVDVVCKNLTLN